MSDQLASGAFVRGLWYFFGIVIAAGIFAGTAGLGLGYIGGVLWEQLHRHRRRERLKAKALAEANADTPPLPIAIEPAVPRLKLVSVDSLELPDLKGRTVNSVRFHARGIQLDLSGVRIEISGNPLIILSAQRIRYPEPGSRDALCSLIGDTVDRLNAPSVERVEFIFSSGAELVIPRSAVAVA